MKDNRELHYKTCISVCFYDESHRHIVTLDNYRYVSDEKLKENYNRLRSEFHEDDADLMVDLYIDHDLHDTFLVRRQMLERMRSAVAPGLVECMARA